MTIETTTNRISYTGSGTTGPFSFPCCFLADGDLTVIKTTIADGTESTLTLTTDYTVSGAGEAAGGSVTLVATLSSAYKLTIIRDPDILQPADYPANDRFPAATHEEALDRATMIMQRLKDYIDRSFRLSDGDVSGISLILSNLGAGKLIAVNSAGTGIESVAAADVNLATVSAFIQTLLDDATAAAARTTLGAAALAANTFTGLQTFAAGADIASATTVDLDAATGNLVRITGNTPTTGFTITRGPVFLYPTGAWPLTYHATTMPIKGGVSYTCAAGDTVIVSKDGNGTLHIDIIPVALHPAIVTQATAEAGTDTTARLWTAQRVAQAIASLGGGSATPTGAVVDYVGSTAPSEWVLLSGRTIGNASSGGTERANADTSALFTLLWDSMANSEAPVSSGRGASAAADFAANKTITLPDARGRTIAGKDNMGGTTASRITSGGSGILGTTLGVSGGAETVSLTSAQNGAHTHTTTCVNIGGGTYGLGPPGKGATSAQSTAVTSSSSGSGTAHQNTQPTLVLNKIIKL